MDRKRAAGGKGVFQAGKKEGMESGQRSPGVWRVVVEGVKLRGACEHFQEMRKSPCEGPRAGNGRGVEVQVVEGEVVQGRWRPRRVVGGKTVELSWSLTNTRVCHRLAGAGDSG